MILIDKKDVQEMLNETEELSAFAYKVLDEKLKRIPTQATYRECDGCFGASMGDCSGCRRFVLLGKISDVLADTVDKIDDHLDKTPERIGEWLKHYCYKLFHGKHTKRGIKWLKEKWWE